jgi:hypothetical protein
MVKETQVFGRGEPDRIPAVLITLGAIEIIAQFRLSKSSL